MQRIRVRVRVATGISLIVMVRFKSALVLRVTLMLSDMGSARVAASQGYG